MKRGRGETGSEPVGEDLHKIFLGWRDSIARELDGQVALEAEKYGLSSFAPLWSLQDELTQRTEAEVTTRRARWESAQALLRWIRLRSD